MNLRIFDARNPRKNLLFLISKNNKINRSDNVFFEIILKEKKNCYVYFFLRVKQKQLKIDDKKIGIADYATFRLLSKLLRKRKISTSTTPLDPLRIRRGEKEINKNDRIRIVERGTWLKRFIKTLKTWTPAIDWMPHIGLRSSLKQLKSNRRKKAVF